MTISPSLASIADPSVPAVDPSSASSASSSSGSTADTASSIAVLTGSIVSSTNSMIGSIVSYTSKMKFDRSPIASPYSRNEKNRKSGPIDPKPAYGLHGSFLSRSTNSREPSERRSAVARRCCTSR